MPDEPADAGKKLVHGERLDDVVVGADEKSRDAVVGLRSRAGEEQHRELLPQLLPEHAADLVAGAVSERDLQDDQRRRILPRSLQPGLAARGLDDVVALLLEEMGELRSRARVGVNDEDRAAATQCFLRPLTGRFCAFGRLLSLRKSPQTNPVASRVPRVPGCGNRLWTIALRGRTT